MYFTKRKGEVSTRVVMRVGHQGFCSSLFYQIDLDLARGVVDSFYFFLEVGYVDLLRCGERSVSARRVIFIGGYGCRSKEVGSEMAVKKKKSGAEAVGK